MNESRIFQHFYLTDELPAIACRIAREQNIGRIDPLADPSEGVWPGTPFGGERGLVFDGSPVLKAEGELVRSDAEKSFRLEFGGSEGSDSGGLAVGGLEALRFGCCLEGDCGYLRVELTGTGDERFETLCSVSGLRWNVVILDLAGSNIRVLRSIRFSFFGEDDVCRCRTTLRIAALAFGNLFDLNFRRGNPARCFSAVRPPMFAEGSVRFAFEAGEELLFPDWAKPRFTECCFTFGVQDTVRLVLENRSGCERFVLSYATDRNPDFDRSVPFTLSPGGTKTVLVPLVGEPGERLRRLKLAALEGSGSLLLFGIGLEQEKDSVCDPFELDFLARPRSTRQNPRPFVCGERIFDVLDFGAKGDGFFCDNGPIQAALDAASRFGGGKVLVGGGRRYVVSCLRLRSNVELVIERASMLLQSGFAEDYPYSAEYEHDNVGARVNWAHNCLVHNFPLLFGDEVHDVKISGGGTIRMIDRGNECETVGPAWPVHCGGTIHCIPVGFNRSTNIEITDLKIVRAGTYHCFLVHSENIFIRGIRFHDVRCLSTDGIGLAGSKNVVICDSLIETNDDGITLCSMYHDPRSGGWWKGTPGEDNCVRNVEVDGCLVNSAHGGGGKAIAFIPWGTDAPDVELQEIDGIWVHDCILKGGRSVGTWPDNPYFGKQPFDNTETDDYSPVKNVRIEHNEYLSPVTLECIRATNVHSDRLRSSDLPVNGDFENGLSNWTCQGNVRIPERETPHRFAELKGRSKILEGLSGPSGETVGFALEVGGEGIAFVCGPSARIEQSFSGAARIELWIDLVGGCGGNAAEAGECVEFVSYEVGVETGSEARLFRLTKIVSNSIRGRSPSENEQKFYK